MSLNLSTTARAEAHGSGAATRDAFPTLPLTGFLRQPQVLGIVPISKSTLWRLVQARTFPAPLKLSARVTVWRAEDLRRWIEQQGSAS